MEVTVKRAGMVYGDLDITLKNEGWGYFSITVKRNGERFEKRNFNSPQAAKKYALDTYGARF